VGASVGASGFLLAAGGLLTAANARSRYYYRSSGFIRSEYRNFFLNFSLLFSEHIASVG
jgi:hypothetical protein